MSHATMEPHIVAVRGALAGIDYASILLGNGFAGLRVLAQARL